MPSAPSPKSMISAGGRRTSLHLPRLRWRRCLNRRALEKSKGLITATSYMDPGDPRWTQDGSLATYDALVAKYLPGEDRGNFYFLVGYTLAQAMVQVLRQCGDDLSRDNIMRQAASLRNFQPVGLLPGISFFTSRTKYLPIVEE